MRGFSTNALAEAGRLIGVCLLACGVLCAHSVPAPAQEASKPPAIHRVFVPAGKTGEWPKGPWEPIDAREFDELLRAAREPRVAPPSAWIERAEYSGRVTPEGRLEGSFTWSIKRALQNVDVIRLDPLNVDVSDLAWPDRPAIWGLSADGQTALVCDRAQGDVKGKWTLSGRSLARQAHFDVRIPSATVSRVTLDIPADLALESSAGVATDAASENADMRRWQVTLGGETQARLTVIPRSAAQPTPRLLAKSTLEYMVRQDGLELQADFDVEVIGPARETLEFEIPAEVELYSIVSGGDPVPWVMVERDGLRVAQIQPPDPIAGSGRSLRVVALMPARLDRDWSLPDVRLRDAAVLDGAVHLRVEPPLVVHELDPQGLAQTATTPSATGGAAFSFQRLMPTPSLVIRVGAPTLDLSSEAVSLLGIDPHGGTLTSLHRVRALGGSTFALRFHLRPNWDLATVRVLPDPAKSSQDVTNWTVEEDANGHRMLTVELRRALGVGQSVDLELGLRHDGRHDLESIELPVVSLANCRTAQCLVEARYPHELVVELDAPSEFTPLAPDKLPEYVKTLLAASAGGAEPKSDKAPIPTDSAADTLSTESLWLYSNVAEAIGRLTVRPLTPDSEPTRDTPPAVRTEVPPIADAPRTQAQAVSASAMELRSIVAGDGDANDVHRATVALDPVSPAKLQFQLDAPASLIAVRVDGEPAQPIRELDQWVVPAQPGQAPTKIEIQYRTPSVGGILAARRTIPAPKFAGDISRFTWHIALPKGIELAAEPAPLRLSRSIAPLPWTRRLFGPLGRRAAEPVFHPLDADAWRRGLTLSEDAGGPDGLPGDRPSLAGKEWSVALASGTSLPRVLTLETRNRGAVDRAAWIAVVLALLAGIGLRRMSTAGGARLMAIATLAAACFTWLASDTLAELLGGCVAGLLIVSLLPRAVLLRVAPPRREPAAPPNPTSSTITMHPACLLVAAGLIGIGGVLASAHPLRAQPAPDPSIPGASIGGLAPRNVVLVPSGADPATGTQAAHVFAHPDLIAELRQQLREREARFDYLITGADYAVSGNPRESLVVDATYNVSILRPDHRPRIKLPLSNVNLGGPDACTVDGRPHPILRSPDGSAFLIDWDAPGAEKKPGGEASEAVESSRASAHEIKLRLYPPNAANGGPGRLQMGIPPAADSRLIVNVSGEPGRLTARTPAGPVQVLAGESVHLGRAASLDLAWSDANEANVTPTRLNARGVVQVDVHPTWLDVRCRAAYEVLDGTVGRVVWRVPPGAIVRPAPDPMQGSIPQVDLSSNGEMAVTLNEPQTGPFQIDVRLMILRDASDPVVRIPSIDFFSSELNQAEFETSAMFVGVIPSPRFTVSLRNDGGRGVPLSADAYTLETAGFPGLRRPALAWRLEQPAALEVDLSPVAVERRVRLNQEGRFHEHTLDWRTTAEITIANPAAPAFSHTLQVDPRLEIQSIALLEDDVDRLERWSRQDDRLILFLKDGSGRTQNLSIQATLPLPRSAETALPIVRVEQAETVQSQVSLYRDVDVAVEPIDVEPTSDDTPPAASSGANPAEVFVGRFRLADDLPIPRIRTSVREQAVEVDALIVVPTPVNRATTATAAFRFRPTGSTRSHLELRIPAELAQSYELDPLDLQLRTETMDDGAVQLVVVPPADRAGDVVVSMKLALAAPGEGDWTLPAIATPGAAVQSSYLAFSSSAGWRMKESTATSRADSLPDWGAMFLPDVADPWTFSRSSGEPWILSDETAAANRPATPIPLVQTSVWQGSDDTETGRTIVLLIPDGRSHLEVSWPPKVELDACRVNGQPLTVEAAMNDRLTIPLAADAAPCVVELDWRRRGGGLPSLAGTATCRVPSPVGSDVGESLLSIYPRTTGSLFVDSDVERAGAADIAFARVDALIELNQAARDRRATSPFAWGALRSWRAFIETHRGEYTAKPTERSRLERIDAEIAELAPVFATADEPNGNQSALADWDAPWQALGGLSDGDRLIASTGGLEETLDPRAVHVRLASPADPMIDYWLVSRPLVAGLSAFGGLALAAFLARRFRRIGGWIAARPAAGWAALGGLWWACFTPSAVGLLLLLVPVSALAFQRVRRNGH